MIILRQRTFSLESNENNGRKILDSVSDVHGIAALGSLGYGATKLSQVGRDIYNKTKEKSTKLGKAKEVLDGIKSAWRRSGRSFKYLNTLDSLVDEYTQKHKDIIDKSAKSLEELRDKAANAKSPSPELYDEIKSNFDKLKRIRKNSNESIRRLGEKKVATKIARNLKKARIAGRVALATGGVYLGTKAISKNLKKEKKYSIESGSPDKNGSLGRELVHKSKIGGLKGSIVGSSLGATLGTILGITLEDIKLSGIIMAAGLSIGTLVGALSKMSESLGSERKLKQMKSIGMNQILDYIQNSIKKDNMRGYGVKGEDLISRYINLDGDPEKFNLTISIKDGVGLMVVDKTIVPQVDLELEKLIEDNRKASYSSEKLQKDKYLVKLIIPSVKAIANLIYNLCYKHHIRINCITKYYDYTKI